jgi:hypothetical protein
MILWPRTSPYDEKVATLKLSPQAADTLLVAKTRDRPDRYFDRTPIFLVGNWYFFAVPSKTGPVGLQGFYVDGMSGRIEYRVSNKTVKHRSRKMPDDAFQSTSVLNEP